MVGDFYGDMFRKKEWFMPAIGQPATGPLNPAIPIFQPPITRAEFDELKRQVAEMKELLIRAKKYDEANNEPECEIDEKMEILRKVAKLVGISLDDVIGRKSA